MEKGKGCTALTLLPPTSPTLILTLTLCTLILPGRAEDPRLPEEIHPQPHNLVVDLGEVLEYNQDREKKAIQVPRCDIGERCAMKYGPRIGKLCDCLRGASCNSFMLRCY